MGIIKEVFAKKRVPFGLLELLYPTQLKGKGALFLMDKVVLPPDQKKLLQFGMKMQCFVKDGDDTGFGAPFIAEEVSFLC